VRPIVVFESRETADDRIAREAGELDGPYWLVTSDRGLRDRAADRAERVIGGGTFARELIPSAAGDSQRRSGNQRSR
jgi:rRNA-processing protein FCF1